MDLSLLQKAVDYHGKDLVECIRTEQGESVNRFIQQLKQKPVDTETFSHNRRVDPLLEDGGRRSLVQSFIAKKADMLFKASKTNEGAEQRLSATELEEKDKYAIIPPFECFMRVDEEARKRHFYNTLSKGDVVIGRVSGRHIHGLIINLLCLNAGKMRFIDDLDIKCFCHLHHIPQVSAHEDPLDEFNVNDLVQGVVSEINVENAKIYITMIESSFAHVTQLHLKLGLITEDDLPLHFKKSLKLGGESFETAMNKTLGFMNPSIVSQLAAKMNVDVKRLPSLMRGLHQKEYPKEDYSRELYKLQCSQWAYKSVKQGIDYFKAGNNVEAFQCLNKALQIDPNNVEAFVARGALYANNSGLSRALEDFEKALEIDPAHVNARKFIVTTLIANGKQLEEDGLLEEAMRNYKRAMHINPSNAEAVQHMKQSQKKLAEQENSRIRSREMEMEEKAGEAKSKKEQSTKERLKQLLSVERLRRNSEGARDRKKQKSMSPVEISSTSTDSSEASSTSTSSSSSSSSDDGFEGKSRKRKNGSRRRHYSSSSKRRKDRKEKGKRRSTSSSASSASKSKSRPRKLSVEREDTSSGGVKGRRRESMESSSSSHAQHRTTQVPLKESQKRPSLAAAATNPLNSSLSLRRTSGDGENSAGKFPQNNNSSSSGVSRPPTTTTAASSSTLNQLETFLASLRAAKSASILPKKA